VSFDRTVRKVMDYLKRRREIAEKRADDAIEKDDPVRAATQGLWVNCRL
jgi:hypothetical protein